MLIKLKINVVRLVINILKKYMVAVAVPIMFRNNDIPTPIDIGKIKPQAKNIKALMTEINTMLVGKE